MTTDLQLAVELAKIHTGEHQVIPAQTGQTFADLATVVTEARAVLDAERDQDPGAGFTVDAQRFAEVLAARAADDGISVDELELDAWSRARLDPQLGSFVAQMADAGALVSPIIGGESVELVFDGDDLDYVAAVRPCFPARWMSSGVQVATYWEEWDQVVPCDADGYLTARGPVQLRQVLDDAAEVGNRLLPTLSRLAAR